MSVLPAVRLVLLLLLIPQLALAGGLADRLERQFGTGEIRAGAKRWSDGELAILKASLEALDPKERRALRGVDIVRMGLSPRPFGAGLYKVDRRGARILVYDRAFKGEGKGSARRPNRTIVHEVGHALSHKAVRDAQRKAKQDVDAANVAVDAYNQEVRRYNRAVRRHNQARRAGKEYRFGGSQDYIRMLRDRKDGLIRTATDSKKRTRRLHRAHRSPLPRTGLLEEYRSHLRGRRGPTPYGRTTLQESFAESFSLHHCDPAALEKALPRVAQWFRQRGHLGGR